MSDATILERVVAPVDAEIAALYADLMGRVRSGPAAGKAFAIELVAREAVQNAVDYGCARDPGRRVRFSARLSDDLFTMRVDDEGKGFDAARVLETERAREPGASGNGVSIIAVYADRYRYENGGRTLIAEFVLGEAGAMQQDEAGRALWAPDGDIVAANAQAAKEELRVAVASSSGEFTIDLSSVRMIDSKGLGLLIAALNSLQGSGRTMRVTGANEDLLGLFKMMRLDRHLKLGQG